MHTLTLTQQQADVLFHILNNYYGPCVEDAVARAAACDNIHRSDFFAAHNALSKMAINATDEDLTT